MHAQTHSRSHIHTNVHLIITRVSHKKKSIQHEIRSEPAEDIENLLTSQQKKFTKPLYPHTNPLKLTKVTRMHYGKWEEESPTEYQTHSKKNNGTGKSSNIRCAYERNKRRIFH